MDNPDEPKESKNELGTTPSRLSKAASESVSDPSIGSLETRNSQNGDESVAGVVVRAIATDLPLTKNQSNQQATTFLFSLIEGRCKSQARSTINSGRRKEDQLSEDDPEVCALAESIFKETVVVMKRAGRFPEEVDIPGPSERRDYLKAFDTRLSDIATRQYPVNAVDRITYNRFEDSQPYSFSEDVSSLFDRSQLHSCSHSQNLVPQPFIRVPQMMASSPLDSLLYPSGIDAYQQESAYHRKFSQICLLGKGGFGQVFRARHKLDDQDYAIKQIRVSASQLRSIHDQVQLEHLLKELRALAKLQHRNVVRYYDSWCEYRAASWRNTRSGQHLLENGPSNLSDSESSSSSSSSALHSEAFGSDPRDIQVDNETELRREIRKNRRESFLEPSPDPSVIFELSYDSPRDVSKASGKSESEQSSAPKNSLFRKPSEMSDDEESIEEIQNQNSVRDIQNWDNEKDMMIFIQMAPYPLTLEDFIWSEQQANSDARLQHCFHWRIAADMLLAILDGVEYIHGQDIVHRDLKPSNIFLSTQRGNYRPEGSVNVTGCTHCNSTSRSDEHIFVTPHIGDFGLIAKVDSSSSPKKTTFSPSPLAVLSSVASSRQPGTKFYAAPKDEESQRISPKLDVYSLGIIACEMLIKFGTRSERLVVLSDLNNSKLDVLRGHPMETGIRGMLDHDVEKRWSCAAVREWIGEVLSHG